MCECCFVCCYFICGVPWFGWIVLICGLDLWLFVLMFTCFGCLVGLFGFGGSEFDDGYYCFTWVAGRLCCLWVLCCLCLDCFVLLPLFVCFVYLF